MYVCMCTTHGYSTAVRLVVDLAVSSLAGTYRYMYCTSTGTDTAVPSAIPVPVPALRVRHNYLSVHTCISILTASSVHRVHYQ